jgi:hypothetical protein
VRGGSGGGGATWRGGEKPAEAGQAVGAGAGGHVVWRGAARGQLGLGKRPAKAAGSWARAEQGEGLEVEDRDLSAIFQIMEGLHYKAKLTFKL